MRTKERLPRKRYYPEFKMELVRLAPEQEGSIAALARQHDVNDNLLFKWIRLWQREGRVCRPRKNASSLLALVSVKSIKTEPASPGYRRRAAPVQYSTIPGAFMPLMRHPTLKSRWYYESIAENAVGYKMSTTGNYDENKNWQN